MMGAIMRMAHRLARVGVLPSEMMVHRCYDRSALGILNVSESIPAAVDSQQLRFHDE